MLRREGDLLVVAGAAIVDTRLSGERSEGSHCEGLGYGLKFKS